MNYLYESENKKFRRYLMSDNFRLSVMEMEMEMK